jgi:hypothetical protein
MHCGKLRANSRHHPCRVRPSQASERLWTKGTASAVSHSSVGGIGTGAPRSPQRTPGFPVELPGVDELHAAFLNESRTRIRRWRPVQEIRDHGPKTDFSNAFTPLHEDSCPWPVSFAHVTEALEGLRPSFSAHVRFGEHGAPVQNQRQWLRDEIPGFRLRSNLDKSG